MNYVISILVFFLGMLFASFYNVIALRVPKKKTLLGRSECPHCHHELSLIDVLPMIGFLINKGKCHFCDTKIALKYLLVEVVGGMLFLGSYLILGLTLNFAVACIMISVLIIETISDYEYFEVIDIVWMIGIVPLIVIRIFESKFMEYFISSAALFLFMFLLSYVGKKLFKKEALGGGDIKLYLFIGFVLPVINGFLSLFIASLFGFIYGVIQRLENGKEIPLVPFISVGVLISFFLGNTIINWYLSLLGV